MWRTTILAAAGFLALDASASSALAGGTCDAKALNVIAAQNRYQVAVKAAGEVIRENMQRELAPTAVEDQLLAELERTVFDIRDGRVADAECFVNSSAPKCRDLAIQVATMPDASEATLAQTKALHLRDRAAVIALGKTAQDEAAKYMKANTSLRDCMGFRAQ
jgi:hypothetical protein